MSKTKTTLATKETLTVPVTAKDVPAAIESLKKQLESLKGNVEDTISTDIKFQNINVKDVKTLNELLQISALIHAKEEAYNKEVIRYNLQSANLKPFQESDKPVSHWEKVISKAIFELINNVQIKKLESAISKLSQHLDAETKLANDLADIMGSATAQLQ